MRFTHMLAYRLLIPATLRHNPFNPHISAQAILELIEQCVASKPQQRPTAAQALERLRSETASSP